MSNAPTVSGAERCGCLNEGRAERLEDRSGIPPLYQNASFDNFKTEGQQELKSVLNDVRTFAREFPLGQYPGLLLIGEPGTGKTHLAVAALRHIIAEGLRRRLHRLSDSARPHTLGLRFGLQLLGQRSVPAGPGLRSAAARRPGRAPRHGLGAGHRHLDRHPPLQQQEAADRHHQSARRRCRQQLPCSAARWDPNTAARCATTSATARRSRLFEMCKVIRIGYSEDYRVGEARSFEPARRPAANRAGRTRGLVRRLPAGGGVPLLSLPAHASGSASWCG